nr:GNAT family N-acetyltransferase [Cohnella lubricantis]
MRLEHAPDKPVLKPRFTTVYIADLGVDENRRGQGLGSQPLQHIVELAKQRGADDVELQSSEFNEGAIRLYEKFGFRTKTRKMELLL